MHSHSQLLRFGVLTLTLGIVACNEDRVEAPDVDPSYLADFAGKFEDGALIGNPSLVDCKLSGGTRTRCVSITVKIVPDAFTPGPWCPGNIAYGPEKAGIWLDNGNVYDADGSFIEGLAAFYKDSFWQLFDAETGAVNVTDTKEKCQAAARPDVDPKYFNHCVECQPSYLDDGATMTYVIPISPVTVDRPEKRVGFSGVGLAFSGVRMDAPAPVDDILDAHTLAPFDDCGGHVNLHVGYHLHAVTDCLKEIASMTDHEPVIGVAMDGFSIHARTTVDAQELDRCGGHEINGLGYHYHAAEPGRNAILGCHTGETGCASEDADRACDATARPPRP